MGSGQRAGPEPPPARPPAAPRNPSAALQSARALDTARRGESRGRHGAAALSGARPAPQDFARALPAAAGAELEEPRRRGSAQPALPDGRGAAQLLAAEQLPAGGPEDAAALARPGGTAAGGRPGLFPPWGDGARYGWDGWGGLRAAPLLAFPDPASRSLRGSAARLRAVPARCGWPVAVRWCVRGADSCGIRGAAAARGARGRGRSCGSRRSRTVAEPPLLWFVPAVVLLRAALGLERSRIFALELLSQCGPGPRCGGIAWGVLMLSAPSPFPSRCVRMNTGTLCHGPLRKDCGTGGLGREHGSARPRGKPCSSARGQSPALARVCGRTGRPGAVPLCVCCAHREETWWDPAVGARCAQC